jgi:hypothetical protein
MDVSKVDTSPLCCEGEGFWPCDEVEVLLFIVAMGDGTVHDEPGSCMSRALFCVVDGLMKGCATSNEGCLVNLGESFPGCER